MRLLLIRHGQTPSNVAGLLDTAIPGPGLTDLGRRQAAAIPGALEGRDFDVAAVSPLVRTRLTGDPLFSARGLDPLELPGLREVEAGALEMSGRREDQQTYIRTAFAWAAGDLDRAMPGGPDGHDFFSRYDAAVRTLAETWAGSAVVVSHGAAIRCWSTGRVRGLDAATMQRTALVNTGAVEAEGDPESGWELVDFHPAPLGGPELAPETPSTTVIDDPTGGATK